MKVVISQPFFFPWVGMLEQIRLADVYVHYGDVQFSKGSFVNRVQIKTAQGVKWLTVPLENVRLGQVIDQVKIRDGQDWKRQHLDMLKQAYAGSDYRDEMLELVRSVYAQPVMSIGHLSKLSIEACCDYFGLTEGRRFIDVQELGISGASSQRVFDIVQALGGTQYITGWGARNYLDHPLFERAGIEVAYMNYAKHPYSQLHGEFTPYVSVLDLIANQGVSGCRYINSNTIYWKDFIKNE